MTAAFSAAAPSTARSTGRGASASTQSQSPPSVRSAESSDADAGGQRVEGRVPAGAGLHDRLDLGAVLVVVAERRERHRRLARVAVAQDQEAGGRHALGQDLAAEHGRGLGLQQGVQRLQDGFAGGGHLGQPLRVLLGFPNARFSVLALASATTSKDRVQALGNREVAVKRWCSVSAIGSETILEKPTRRCLILDYASQPYPTERLIQPFSRLDDKSI